MAAIAPAPAPPAPAVSAQDPLFEKLVKFVTTGKNARNVSHGKIQQLIDDTKREAGGEAQLQYFASSVEMEHSECQPQSWEDEEDGVFGRVHTDKMSINFIRWTAPTLKVVFDGAASDFFIPGEYAVYNATLFYNSVDDLAPGPVTFTTWQDTEGNLFVNLYKTHHGDQKYIAALQVTIGGDLGRKIHRGHGSLTS